jgi:hypothetical protein
VSALTASLVGGVLAWLGGEAVLGHFAVPSALLTKASALGASKEVVMEAERLRQLAETHNGAVALGLLGAALGLCLGLAGGVVRRRPVRGLAASLLGLVLGGAVGAGVALVLQPALYGWQGRDTDDLTNALLLHGLLAAAVGAVGGLAFGVGLGQRGWTLRSLFGGLVGAALAVLLFQMVAGAILPIGKPETVVPMTSLTRLLSRLVLGLGTAVGIGLSRPDTRRPLAEPPAPEASQEPAVV